MRKSKISRNPVSLAVPAGNQATMQFRLFNRLMFFFFVLMDDYKTKENCPGKQYEQDNGNFIHFPSPLSSKYPRIKNAKNNIKPIEKFNIVIFSGDNIRPAINMANVIWLRLKQNLDRFSLLFSVNFISRNILSKAKISVKQVKAKVIPPTCRGSSGIFRERLND